MTSKGPLLTTVGGIHSGVPGIKIEWDQASRDLVLSIEDGFRLRVVLGERTLFDSQGTVPASEPPASARKTTGKATKRTAPSKAGPTKKPSARRVTHD